MNIFELTFFVGLVAAILVASKWVGSLLAISGWFVAVPLAVGAFFGLRQFGGRLAGRRANPWPFERDKNPRTLWKVWFVVLAAFIGIAALPVSNTLTRIGVIVTLLVGWGLLMAIIWRYRRLRASLLVLPALCAVFLMLPQRTHENTELLRHDFVASLRQYEGVRYFWGGESFTGIDCSGLVRRGLIDAMFRHGIRTFDAGSVRYAIWLWWHDCSARDLGQGRNNLTIPVLETPSINDLDHSRLTPGDLAVTKGGEHVMAYVGDNLWIEADPLAHRVITVRAPSQSNAWFHGPMRIVRWSILSQ